MRKKIPVFSIEIGDKEKKYAKKERGEIDKDDPDWKSRAYHTGMHGEENRNVSID